MPRTNNNLKGKWTEEKMIKALEAVGSEMTSYKASIIYNTQKEL